MDPTLRERLAAMVAAYDEMRAAPDRDGPERGPVWQAACNRYCALLGEVPGHLGLARLVLELDAEVQRLKANEAAREGVLRRTTDQLRAHDRFADDVAIALAVPERMHHNAPILLDALRVLRSTSAG